MHCWCYPEQILNCPRRWLDRCESWHLNCHSHSRWIYSTDKKYTENKTGGHIDNNVGLTSSIWIGQVREPPDITKTHSKPHESEDEFQLSSPSRSLRTLRLSHHRNTGGWRRRSFWILQKRSDLVISAEKFRLPRTRCSQKRCFVSFRIAVIKLFSYIMVAGIACHFRINKYTLTL